MYKGIIFAIIASILIAGILFYKKFDYKSHDTKLATFAGGCFWCMQPPFQKLNGVHQIVTGYTGGKGENPDYNDYSQKGHVEAVQISYDPKEISYKKLLDVFWKQIDPTDPGGQFSDRGEHYRSVIFYHDIAQKKLAEKSKKALQQSGKFEKPIVTEILPASVFYEAEKYHQDYKNKNPEKYKRYRKDSGREDFLKKMWPKSNLTPMQYEVTQHKATEPAFKNEYWDNKRPGIYVDVVSGEPLFSSFDKFESGTGWPCFTKPLEEKNIVQKEDRDSFRKSIEVRSKNADSHLGHLFHDGPKPTGLRYCINSAALRFIPIEKLEE